MIRVGFGKDSHKIEVLKKTASNPLTLGGILIDNHINVTANSDGDMVIHSLCNAISTAIGGGSFDIFAGPMCKKGIRDSKHYLIYILEQMKKISFKINNISICIEAGIPRLEGYRDQIVKSLSGIIRLNEDQIGISATSGNGLTSYSKGKGICSSCIVSLIRKDDKN